LPLVTNTATPKGRDNMTTTYTNMHVYPDVDIAARVVTHIDNSPGTTPHAVLKVDGLTLFIHDPDVLKRLSRAASDAEYELRKVQREVAR
jgi:hypothetical protein